MTNLPKTTLPFVGRATELAELRAVLDTLLQRRGATWLVAGEAGVGKTRLSQTLLEEADRRDFRVATGRAFQVESGVPYALFADALLPTVRHLDSDELAVLTRGVGELGYLFPWLAQPGASRPRDADSSDFRSRLHWQFTQFLRGLVTRKPLVVVLEDLHYADTSSLELLHFMARQLTDQPALLFCTYNPERATATAALRGLRQSLGSIGVARQLQLQPLSEDAVGELLHRMFGADRHLIRDFTGLLYRWTRGNPFYLEETIKALVATGELRQEDGRWTGWQIDALRLPASVRDALLARLDGLSTGAREAADTAAVLGARFRFDTLAAALRTTDDSLLDAVDELQRARVLEEVPVDDDVVHDFVHPLIRETLYGSLSRVRLRMLHARVAQSLEQRYGADALNHAGELSYHFSRAETRDADAKAALYLTRGGTDALARYANREAADYLAEAVTRMRAAGAPPEHIIDAVEALARAQQRLGEYHTSTELWRSVQTWAVDHGELLRAASVARRMALASYWTGRLNEALSHVDAGLRWLREAEHAAGSTGAEATALYVRLFATRAACLQELGRFDEGLAAAEEAMRMAERAHDPALLVRVHRLFLQLHIWKGNAQVARQHGTRALELAAQAGEPTLAFVVHWAMGLLEAFAGNTTGFDYHLAAGMRIADELRSPVLRVWAAELALEYASARGEWDEALALGQEAISLARALQQWTLLPRLLVWTGLIHLGRSEIVQAEAQIEEAWKLSGAERSDEGGINVHLVIPAFVGRGWLCHARGDFRGAVNIGEQGLEIADRTGYMVWGVHRLLPLIAESYLWMNDIEGAKRVGERLRYDAERMGHRLGIAWARACEALVDWLTGRGQKAVESLRAAAEQLEAVPFMPDATRLRRQLAGLLAQMGERDAAAQELRLVHDRLLYLGAESELRKARNQFREIGLRPPPRGGTRGTGVLTQREFAIAGLVAGRKSSKAIARELGISVRTVDAHLTNVYRKLSIHTRAELADLVRAGAVTDEE